MSDNPQAFPSQPYGADGLPANEASPGMTLRDYFAGKFLAGAASDNSPLDVSVAADQFDVDFALTEHWGAVARAAYIAADAMLAERERDQ